ncbi:MAG: vWA domain-containing protein [Pirellulaceae bacterium]
MQSSIENRRGAMLILVAFVIIILLIGAVFSVDVAYMHMVRAELRTATDAAARAGSEALARTQNPAAARAAAIDAAARNNVAGDGLTLRPGDVRIGGLTSTASGRFTFDPGGNPLTAVSVVGRRDNSSADGSVPLFFARIFSTNQFEPVQEATAAASVRDVALVLDISGSMSTITSTGTRLSDLQAAVNIFIDEVQVSSPHTFLSLVSYSTTPNKEVELTANFADVRSRVNNFTANGFTAIGNALTMGSDSLASDPLTRAFAAKTIIVMTDGNHNTGPSPNVTVSTAVARGHQVHTITFSPGANQTLMQSVASATSGGQHIHADDAADLAQAFRDIARSLSVVLVD